MREGEMAEVQSSVCVIYLSVNARKKYYSQSLNDWQCLGVPFTLHITFSTLIQQREKRGKRLRKCRGWELFFPWLASYRRSMFFRWLILAKVHNSRLSTLFPAMASLSTALNLSSTAGMWEKLLKESPRLLSWDRPPSSSGRELRWFPSRESVCRLRDGEERKCFTSEWSKYLLVSMWCYIVIFYWAAS